MLWFKLPNSSISLHSNLCSLPVIKNFPNIGRSLINSIHKHFFWLMKHPLLWLKEYSCWHCLLVQVLDRLLIAGETEVRSFSACEEKIWDFSPSEADPCRQLDLHIEHLFRTRSKELQSVLWVKEKRVGVLFIISHHRLECVNLLNERKKIIGTGL